MFLMGVAFCFQWISVNHSSLSPRTEESDSINKATVLIYKTFTLFLAHGRRTRTWRSSWWNYAQIFSVLRYSTACFASKQSMYVHCNYLTTMITATPLSTPLPQKEPPVPDTIERQQFIDVLTTEPNVETAVSRPDVSISRATAYRIQGLVRTEGKDASRRTRKTRINNKLGRAFAVPESILQELIRPDYRYRRKTYEWHINHYNLKCKPRTLQLSLTNRLNEGRRYKVRIVKEISKPNLVKRIAFAKNPPDLFYTRYSDDAHFQSKQFIAIIFYESKAQLMTLVIQIQKPTTTQICQLLYPIAPTRSHTTTKTHSYSTTTNKITSFLNRKSSAHVD